MGYVVSFAYGNLLPVKFKIYILICMLVIGMLMYAVVEYQRRNLHRKFKNEG